MSDRRVDNTNEIHQSQDEVLTLYTPTQLDAIEQRLRVEQQLLMQEIEQRLRHEFLNSNSNRSKALKNEKIANETNGEELRLNSSDNDEAETTTCFSMPDDVFSMLCISCVMSRPFIYALFFVSAKIIFYTVILWEIFYKSVVFPKVRMITYRFAIRMHIILHHASWQSHKVISAKFMQCNIPTGNSKRGQVHPACDVTCYSDCY